MSPSAYIIARTTKTGRRYHVRYRLGGRGAKLIHAGAFPTKQAADERRRFCISEIAAGRDPLTTLRQTAATQRVQARTLAQWGDLFRQSRVDVDTETARGYTTHLNRLGSLTNLDPHTLTWQDVQAWIAEQASTLAPGSISRYLTTIKQVIDFAGVDPSPARDKRVKLPRDERDEITPPTAVDYLLILDKLARKNRLPLVVIEQTAIRVGSVVTLTWGDVDTTGNRFRLRARNTKTDRAMWVQVPDWLMQLVDLLLPAEDRQPDRRVFPDVTETSIRSALTAACRTAGTAHYHPHDFRHRRLSLWHGQGVPARELAARAGHARTSMTLDVYSHVMPLDEARQDVLTGLLVVPR